MEHIPQTENSEYMNNPRISFTCMVLCVILGLVLGVLAKLSGSLTKLLRPAFIAICLITLKHSRYYKLSSTKWHIITLVYSTFIFFIFPISGTTINAYASIALFIVFFAFAGNRVWTKREIKFILIAVTIACTVQAVIALYCNPELLRNGGSSRISFLGSTINRNTVAFGVVPGSICGMFLLLYDRLKKSVIKDIFYLSCCLICSFALFALACRSAFFAAAGGLTCIVWQKTRETKNKEARFAQRIFVIFLILTVLFSTIIVSKGTNSSRLFEFGEDTSGSGRDVIWDEAWRLIDEKPVIGGGYAYWSDSGQRMGTHNSFLTVMVSSGWIGGILLGIFFISALLEVLKIQNLIPLAFMVEVLTHTWTEPGMDYYAYIPLIITFILMRYLQHQNKSLMTIFA